MDLRLAAASLALALSTTACATRPVAPANLPPATVVVAFDRERVMPLIAEGLADRASGRQVAANDPVRIASISKMVMALAALRLAHEGKVDFDADVSGYLGWQLRSPHFPGAKVTLRDLLSHRAALSDRAGYVIPLGESLRVKLADPEVWNVEAAPGEAPFEYANIGSPVVATVLEAATGERFDRIVDRTVFAPLGIDACFNWIGCNKATASRAVVLYRDTGEIARDDASGLPPNCTIPVAEGTPCTLEGYIPGTNASIFSPQGGLRIGSQDLAKIGRALVAEREDVFPRAMMVPARLAILDGQTSGQEFFCIYGLGMQVIEAEYTDCVDNLFEDGTPYIGHPGEAYGLRSGLWFDTKTGAGFAYFISAVPPRQGAEDEGGFDVREIALIQRAQDLLAQQSDE